MFRDIPLMSMLAVLFYKQDKPPTVCLPSTAQLTATK